MSRTRNVIIITSFLAFALFMPAFAQVADFNPDTTEGCFRLPVKFTNVSNTAGKEAIYSWNFGDGQASTDVNPIHIFDTSGLFVVTLIMNLKDDPTLYSHQDTVFVHPRPNTYFTYRDRFSGGKLIAEFTSSPQPNRFDTIQYRYIWSASMGRPDSVTVFHATPNSGKLDTFRHEFPVPAVYPVRLAMVDNFGCRSKTIAPFRISDRFEVPNVFTPNGDDINDFFVVPTNGRTSYDFKVFSPSGHMVYKSLSPTIMWDGTNFNGDYVKPGKYFYIIKAIDNIEVPMKPVTGFMYIFYGTNNN